MPAIVSRAPRTRQRSGSIPASADQCPGGCARRRHGLPGLTDGLLRSLPWRIMYSSKVQQRRRNPPMFSELRTHSSRLNEAQRGACRHFASKGLGVRVPWLRLLSLVSPAFGTLAVRKRGAPEGRNRSVGSLAAVRFRFMLRRSCSPTRQNCQFMQVMTTECLGRSTARQRRAPYAPPARRARLDTIETWEHITTSTDIDIATVRVAFVPR